MAHFLQRLILCGAAAWALGQQIEKPKLKPFSHKTHLKLGNIAPVIAAAIDKGTYLSPTGDLRGQLNTGNACQACHHGMENNSPFLAMADCLVCHNKVDPPIS